MPKFLRKEGNKTHTTNKGAVLSKRKFSRKKIDVHFGPYFQSSIVDSSRHPHINSSEGHWETIVDAANKMAQSGLYRKVYVNKTIKTTEVGSSRRRPDILGVRKDRKVDQIEVPSKTDDISSLENRMAESQRTLTPFYEAGKTFVLKRGETLNSSFFENK